MNKELRYIEIILMVFSIMLGMNVGLHQVKLAGFLIIQMIK